MPVSGAKLTDANVWLALAFSDHQHHAPAKHWFDTQSELTCAFCRITQMALLRHLTNSTIMGRFVQTQAQAWRTYEKLVGDPRVIFLVEPPGVESAFRNLSSADSPSTGLWTDAYLAAFAIASQSQLVTFDSGFRRFQAADLLLLG